MKTIEITSQEEWDSLPKQFDEFTILQIRIAGLLIIKSVPGSSSAELWESSSAVLRGSSRAVLWESSRAVLRESSSAVLWGSSSATYDGETLLQYLEISPLGSRSDSLRAYITTAKTVVRTGCFSGSIDEFLSAVEKTHGINDHSANYQAAVALIRDCENRQRPKCQGIEIEPGVYSGCTAAETGSTDCPECGGEK